MQIVGFLKGSFLLLFLLFIFVIFLPVNLTFSKPEVEYGVALHKASAIKCFMTTCICKPYATFPRSCVSISILSLIRIIENQNGVVTFDRMIFFFFFVPDMIGNPNCRFSRAHAHTKTRKNIPGVACLGLEVADDFIFWLAEVTSSDN